MIGRVPEWQWAGLLNRGIRKDAGVRITPLPRVRSYSALAQLVVHLAVNEGYPDPSSGGGAIVIIDKFVFQGMLDV